MLYLKIVFIHPLMYMHPTPHEELNHYILQTYNNKKKLKKNKFLGQLKK